MLEPSKYLCLSGPSTLVHNPKRINLKRKQKKGPGRSLLCCFLDLDSKESVAESLDSPSSKPESPALKCIEEFEPTALVRGQRFQRSFFFLGGAAYLGALGCSYVFVFLRTCVILLEVC